MSQTGDLEVVAAGRPDIQKLIRAGALKPMDIDPETGFRKQPTAKFDLVNKRVKDRETGKTEMRQIRDYRGHVENPDCPGWRIGLTPEKYWEMLLMEADGHLRGRKGAFAPELTDTEVTSFEEWLSKKFVEDEAMTDRDTEDMPKHPVVRKVLRRKKQGKLEKEVQKPERKKAEPEQNDSLSEESEVVKVKPKRGRPAKAA